MFSCVSPSTWYSQPRFKRVPKSLPFFCYSQSAWSFNHFLLLAAAGLAIRKTFTQRLEQVWLEGWAHPLIRTWSSGSCSSSSKQVFVCLKWHPQPEQPLGQSQNKSFLINAWFHGIISCFTHFTEPQSSGSSGSSSSTCCSYYGLTREVFHFQLQWRSGPSLLPCEYWAVCFNRPLPRIRPYQNHLFFFQNLQLIFQNQEL